MRSTSSRRVRQTDESCIEHVMPELKKLITSKVYILRFISTLAQLHIFVMKHNNTATFTGQRFLERWRYLSYYLWQTWRQLLINPAISRSQQNTSKPTRSAPALDKCYDWYGCTEKDRNCTWFGRMASTMYVSIMTAFPSSVN